MTRRAGHGRTRSHGRSTMPVVVIALAAGSVAVLVLAFTGDPEEGATPRPASQDPYGTTRPSDAGDASPQPANTPPAPPPTPAADDEATSEDAPAPLELWVEVESGQGHTATQDKPRASGLRHVGWFGKGKSVSLSYDLPRDIEKGRLYLRFGRGERATPGALVVELAGPDGTTRQAGTMELAFTGAWDRYAWTSIALGAMAGGVWKITLSCPTKNGSGDLDVTVLIDDRWDGLWEPPDKFNDGVRLGEGRLAPAFAWHADPKAFRGVFLPGEEIIYTLTASNRSSARRTATLSWVVRDYEGIERSASSAEFTVDGGADLTRGVALSSGLRRGWYLAELEDSYGTSIHRYFACMDPPRPKDRTASRFGLNTHGMSEKYSFKHAGDAEADMRMAARLGVGWLRGLGLWHLVQKGSSRDQAWRDRPYDWTKTDRMLELSEKYGMERMGSLAFSVAWASSKDPHHANWWGQSFYPPDDLSGDGPYATYVRKTVERYRDRIRYWEQWNEPDGAFWKGSPEEYVKLLACAHDAARSADPDAIILNGGFANIGLGNHQRMLAAGIGSHHEHLAVHGYNNSFLKVWPVKRIFRQAGAWPKTVWNTESGREPNLKEHEPLEKKLPWMRGQAEEVVRTYMKNFASDVERLFWFCYAWEPYGMFTDTGPRPSAMAYRTLSDLIDTPRPATLLGTLDLGADARGVFAFVYERDDGAAVIIWREPKPAADDPHAAPELVAVPVDEGARAVAYGVDGRDLRCPVSAGVMRVPARGEPTLVDLTGSINGLKARIGWTRRYPGPVVASVRFTGADPVSDGMYAGAYTLTKSLDGKRCAATSIHDGANDGDRYYIRFDLADDLLWEVCDTYGRPKRPLKLRITYYDRGSKPFGIQYAESTFKVERRGTNTWKTATLSIQDLAFPNQNCHVDLRITSWGWASKQDVELHSLELIEE